MARTDAAIRAVEVMACRIPTDAPEADGTLAWNSTVLVAVEIEAGGARGLGYTYANVATAGFIREQLVPCLMKQDAMAIPSRWRDMWVTVRNLGRSGVAAMAISAVDVALWDLKARLLQLPLVSLLGQAHQEIPVYGSGGFTSYDDAQLTRQFSAWLGRGIRAMKMKVGADPVHDLQRVRIARELIGPEVELLVDANGAWDRKRALLCAEAFAEFDVRWFEEPVSSDDLVGLRLLRDRAPAGMDISAGEYGYTLDDFRRLLEAQAVDVLQADATRCGGVSGLLRVAALCEASHVPLSSHTAPALHLHVCAAAGPMRHMEWFHDHARIESLLFDGAPQPQSGVLAPDLSQAGHGLSLRRDAARQFAVA